MNILKKLIVSLHEIVWCWTPMACELMVQEEILNTLERIEAKLK